MASKKTETQSAKGKTQAPAQTSARGASAKAAPGASRSGAKAAPKAAPKKEKAAPVPQGPRHPRAKLLAGHSSKEALAKTLAPALARADEDPDAIAARLKTASNRQLLRLATVHETLKKKWGTREKLIAAIGAAQKKSKDQAFLARLDTYSLPRLVDLARSAGR